MDEKVVKFLKRHRIGVLTTMLSSGQPHSATIHYAFDEKTFSFIIWTGAKSRKLNNLKKGETQKGSMVIGFSEEEWLTMQMEGEVKWLSDFDEIAEVWPAYSEKYAEEKQFVGSENDALIKFTPVWWRYTEVKPSPSLIISSEDKYES